MKSSQSQKQQKKYQTNNKPQPKYKSKSNPDVDVDEISEEEEEKDNIFGEESDFSENNDYDNEKKVVDQDEEEDLKEFGAKKDVEEEGEGEVNKTDDLIENMNLEEINLKIQHILNVLSDLKQNKEEGMSRSQYMDELKRLLMVYYDYNDDIMTLILYLFHPNEALEFLESSNGQRVMSIRTNTLKTKRRELAKILINRGVNLDPLAEWTKVGLKIYDSTVPVGATPEYLSGHYMLQSGSSFLPVIALDPQENEKILDMSAAPGGKTTYIAQLMKNTGVLVANDLKKERLKSLYFNVHRLGVKNCIITNYDGKKLSKLYSNFDRVLLDAPCSGLGVISKDPSVKVNRTYKDIIETTRIQKELLLSAIDCCSLKNNIGIIVYSTCSISVEENEWVVDYALKHRYVKLVDLNFEVGEEGLRKFRGKNFHPTMNLTKRIYPHLQNMDGFFVAKLQKYANGEKKIEESKEKKNKKKKKRTEDVKEAKQEVKEEDKGRKTDEKSKKNKREEENEVLNKKRKKSKE